MSVVVAIKDEDKVWVACDSQMSTGWTKVTLSNPNNYKIIKPSKESDTIIGIVGSAKLQNVLKIQEEFIDELTKLKDELNFKYIVETVVPKLFKIAKQYGLVKKEENQDVYTLEGAFIFAHKDKLFSISPRGYVVEIDDYCATGSGQLLSIGSLNTNSNENKKDAIINAVKASCMTDLYVNYPIIVMNTKDDEVIVINK